VWCGVCGNGELLTRRWPRQHCCNCDRVLCHQPLDHDAGAVCTMQCINTRQRSDKYIDGAWKNDAWYEEDAEKVGNYGKQAITDAGVSFNMNCPLDGDFKIGTTWKMTH